MKWMTFGGCASSISWLMRAKSCAHAVDLSRRAMSYIARSYRAVALSDSQARQSQHEIDLMIFG